MRPRGWFGKETELDDKSARILGIVYQAGKSISYRDASKLIEEEVKRDGQSNKQGN